MAHESAGRQILGEAIMLVRDLKYPEGYLRHNFKILEPGEDEENELNHEHFICSECNCRVLLHLNDHVEDYEAQRGVGICIECDQE